MKTRSGNQRSRRVQEDMERCDYWTEIEFMAADRKFDGGEFSGPLQDEKEMKYEPCGSCGSCREAANDAMYPEEY